MGSLAIRFRTRYGHPKMGSLGNLECLPVVTRINEKIDTDHDVDNENDNNN